MQLSLDFTHHGEPRLLKKGDPRHRLLAWARKNVPDGRGDALLDDLANWARIASKALLEEAGLNPMLWTPRSACLQYAGVNSPQGPPMITGSAPSYQGWVDLGCCLERIMVFDGEPVSPVQAAEFIELPLGGLPVKTVLSRRPDVESYLYKVGCI